MGRKVFLSFLGLGPYNKELKTNDYEEAIYEFNDKKSKKVKFVQLAELDILSNKDKNIFDKIVIVGTKKSLDLHYKTLSEGIKELLDTNIIEIEISEDMSTKGQWDWFNKILEVIDFGDRLTIDLTHGYRSIPIIISTAISFLQNAKNIYLEHIFYGAYEKNREISPIVDMKEFYVINDLADGVSRLIENADVRKLADVIEESGIEILPELSNKKVIEGFKDLTDSLRNIDINNISEITNRAFDSIKNKEKNASKVGKLLLKLVIDKFISINSESESKIYNSEYFKIQIEIIKILIEHRLYMQAFTVMRELVGSIGMLSIDNLLELSNKKLKKKRKYAEIFINMIQFDRKEWKFSKESINNNKSEFDRMKEILPFYKELDDIEVIGKLKKFVKDMTKIRNGFDHAWMSKRIIPDDVEQKSKEYFGKLNEIITDLTERKIINE